VAMTLLETSLLRDIWWGRPQDGAINPPRRRNRPATKARVFPGASSHGEEWEVVHIFLRCHSAAVASQRMSAKAADLFPPATPSSSVAARPPLSAVLVPPVATGPVPRLLAIAKLDGGRTFVLVERLADPIGQGEGHLLQRAPRLAVQDEHLGVGVERGSQLLVPDHGRDERCDGAERKLERCCQVVESDGAVE
jgi:hypothetical protein